MTTYVEVKGSSNNTNEPIRDSARPISPKQAGVGVDVKGIEVDVKGVEVDVKGVDRLDRLRFARVESCLPIMVAPGQGRYGRPLEELRMAHDTLTDP
eukprot:1687919-Pyramimonas_sp.AAC.1